MDKPAFAVRPPRQLRPVLSSIALAGAMLAASTPASSAPSFYSTTAAPGSADPVWTVAAAHGGFNDGQSRFNNILANVAFGKAYAWHTYSSPAGSASILANNPSGSNGGIGNYEYFIFRQTFDLTGYDASTANLRFRWGCDDVPSTGAVGWMPAFSLNGGALQGAGTCGAYTLGGEVSLNTGFINGLNTLDFYVEGNGQTDGFALLAASFSAQTAAGNQVPEPMSLLLMAVGLIGLGLTQRRRTARISGDA